MRANRDRGRQGRAGSRRRARLGGPHATSAGIPVALEPLEPRLLMSNVQLGPTPEPDRQAVPVVESRAQTDPLWPLDEDPHWTRWTDDENPDLPAMAATSAAETPEAAVAAELAFLAANVPAFHVVDLPRDGAVTLDPADAITIEQLRGVPLDPDPPVLGQPAVAFPSHLRDGFAPGEAPYVAEGIGPFRFAYFNNEFNYGGWYNADITAYAATHGFNIVSPNYGSLSNWLDLLPADTQISTLFGMNWTTWMLQRDYDEDAYDQLPDREELARILLEDRTVPAAFGRDLVTLDLEHPTPQGSLDSPGFVNTHLAPIDAARAQGWPVVGVYGSGAQPFPRTWFGLATADLSDPAVTVPWDRYIRQISEAVDVLLPSVYSYYWNNANVAFTLANIDLNMQMLAQNAASKPVRPYVWTLLHGGGGGWRWWRALPMRTEELRAMTALSYFAGIDGLADWNSSGTGNHHRTSGDIRALDTVQVVDTFDLQPAEPDLWPTRTAQRYDALYVREVSADGQVRYQFIRQDLSSRNYGVVPNIGMIGQWLFDQDAEDSARRTPVVVTGGSFEAGRHGGALRFDGDDAIDIPLPDSVTIEAESMALSGFAVQPAPEASGGAVISREGAGTPPPGVAQTTFGGADGYYHVAVSFLHENDGDSQFKVKRNGAQIGAWTAWTGRNATPPDGRSLETRVAARDVYIRNGDVISLEGIEDETSYAAFDRIRFTPTLRFTYGEPFTISTWVKVPASPRAEPQVLLGNSLGQTAGWNIQVTPDNKVAVVLREDGSIYKRASTRKALPTAQWVHLAAVWGSNRQLTLYVNGVKDSVAIPGSADALDFRNEGGITIGSLPDGTHGFQGSLDQLRIYKQALTDTEVVGLYDEGRYPVYVATRQDLEAHLRPKSEAVAAQIEGLALVRPFEYLLRHGQVHIDVDARTQFDANPAASGLTTLPIVRRVSLGGYHLIATYDPNALDPAAPPATIVLPDFNGEPGLELTLPADAQTRLFVVRDWRGPRADAGADRTVRGGDQVDLAGLDGDADFDGPRQFAWSQTGGPPVELAAADTPVARFTAPEVNQPTRLSFRLEVAQLAEPGLSDHDEIDILVLPAAPRVDFSSSVSSGDYPLVVDLVNDSTGLIDAYLWDFGDGSTSTEAAPRHTYRRVGTFTVSLTASGPGGSTTLTRPDLITVNGINEILLEPGSSIADAVALLPEAGVLRLAPGRHEAPDPITLKPDLRLVGSGRFDTVLAGSLLAAPGCVVADLTLETSAVSAPVGLRATDADLEVSGLYFTGDGVGLRLERSGARVHHSIFEGDTGMTVAVAVSGGPAAGLARLENNVFRNVAGAAVRVDDAAALPWITNSIFAGNGFGVELPSAAGPAGGRVTFNAFHANTADVTWSGAAGALAWDSLGEGNVHADPRFVGQTGTTAPRPFDYHLQPPSEGGGDLASPLIDGGTPPMLVAEPGAGADTYQGSNQVLVTSLEPIEAGQWLTLRGYHLEESAIPLEQRLRVVEVLAPPGDPGRAPWVIRFEQPIVVPIRAGDYLVSDRSDFGAEPSFNGRRIDIGAYGGTVEATATPPPRLLAGDLDLDGLVGMRDLDAVLQHWAGSGNGSPLFGDADGDGRVGQRDLDAVLSTWALDRRPAGTETLLFDALERLTLRLLPGGGREIYIHPGGRFTRADLESSGILRGSDRVLEVV